MVKISLFIQMLSLIPRDKFDRLISKHAYMPERALSVGQLRISYG